MAPAIAILRASEFIDEVVGGRTGADAEQLAFDDMGQRGTGYSNLQFIGGHCGMSFGNQPALLSG
jgi:hypothetical protein